MSIIFITGGHGCGKTAQALKLAAKYPQKTYIATAEIIDSEMANKIEKHRQERDNTYVTVEESLYLADKYEKSAGFIIIDCITVWVNNLIYYKADIDTEFSKLIKLLKLSDKDTVIVSNESTFSLVPADKLSRTYIKHLTYINRELAELADKVCLMVSGIPVWVKGGDFE